jgi:hypothetical protein
MTLDGIFSVKLNVKTHPKHAVKEQPKEESGSKEMRPNVTCLIVTHEERSNNSFETCEVNSIPISDVLIVLHVFVPFWDILPGSNERLFRSSSAFL